MSKAVGYWSHSPDGRIQCDVCPRHCQLRDGQRGMCFVRQCENDGMVLTTYGRSSGFCIDPIEKKPLNHFFPGTSVLSFGTAGCNLGCRFCQNWDMSKSRQMDTLAAVASPHAIAHAASIHGCRSVAFTYNDPTIFLEYAIDAAIACHEQRIKTVAVSAGYICAEARRDLYAHIDAANIDLKGFTESFYQKTCLAELKPVLDTLIYLVHETSVWVEITNLIIPNHNDAPSELRAMCRWIFHELGPDVPVHFSAFHPDFKMRDVPRTPPSTLTTARQIALDEGLHFSYTGNVHDTEGDTTFCRNCGEALIVRDWYNLHLWNLDATGACPTCQTILAGHLEAVPGDWGSRRLPIQIA